MSMERMWSYRPYIPVDEDLTQKYPYICRLSPLRDGVQLEWINNQKGEICLVHVKERQDRYKAQFAASSCAITITGLKERCDYEVWIEGKHQTGEKRLFRTGEVPGTVIHYLHPEDRSYYFSGNYLCSPSIVRSPDGSLLASLDYFGRDRPQNLTSLFRSTDDGKSWKYVTDLFPCFWGKLFVHREKLYMLALSTEYGDLLIGCSEDNGETWRPPAVIARGSCSPYEKGFHRAPCQIITESGRLWTSLEYGSWKQGFSNAVISIDKDADLCKAENWIISEWVRPTNKNCAIEGSLVMDPKGRLLNVLRYQDNRALILKADLQHPDKALQLLGEMSFPMAHSKFEILHQTKGGYISVGNRYPMRNVLSVYTSMDLKTWKLDGEIVNASDTDSSITGFQYPSCLLEGSSMYVAVRTAFNGAHNYHDNNYCTFYKYNLTI
ncbi:sialidase family protein [Ructibacterium gallinarum]|uniref:Exo-alpha-sialidase n=1 Tax=Ructibacterium gallinarum TaxID=2779355 RepID=A0A9D5LZW3_9FIRM|nr:sialidase family protein [Ructibacterium gallinarum]MBE5041026.1 exo-alpha-sialidase [Ructibacterium gallinarum]